MNKQEHWENVYGVKQPTEVSWFAPHLDTSLVLIDSANLDPEAAMIDIGGGTSTLVDDLLDRGFGDLTVLDISSAALENTEMRLGERAAAVR